MSEEQIKFEEADEISFSDFYESIEEKLGTEEDNVVSPDSRVNARDWLLAVLKTEDEIAYYKDEYIPHLVSRYVDPVREKMAKLTQTREFLRNGLREFLENADEKSVVFPDLATVSRFTPGSKIIYPEDEKGFLSKLINEDSEFIRKDPKIDKKKISDEFKKTGKIPVDGLVVEEPTPTVKITRVKKKN